MTERRTATIERTTRETAIRCTVDLDGRGDAEVDTGIGFLDHMLTALAKHGGLSLTLTCRGDLHVDDHHTVEDCALALGEALLAASGERRGIRRFGHAYAPLDEALVRAVVDLSGRPWPEVAIPFVRPTLGTVATENLVHFLESLAIAARMTLHVDVIKGRNDHHKIEAAFKAFGRALDAACRVDPRRQGTIPSTKGTL
jgi:imidazoleglycerol phosphate dehydratase HisB